VVKVGQTGTARAAAAEATQPVTIAQLAEARAAMALWLLQTQTRRAQYAAGNATIRCRKLVAGKVSK
jgi:hypothetical protein